MPTSEELIAMAERLDKICNNPKLSEQGAMEVTGAMERAGWDVEELKTPDRMWSAMIEAGRI